MGTDYSFEDCRFWPSVAISGTGSDVSADGPEDGVTLALTVSGDHTGDLAYRYSPRTEAFSLTGTWDGQPANLPRSQN
jgi:hypothetical protein